jgi:hypothetical protein
MNVVNRLFYRFIGKFVRFVPVNSALLAQALARSAPLVTVPVILTIHLVSCASHPRCCARRFRAASFAFYGCCATSRFYLLVSFCYRDAFSLRGTVSTVARYGGLVAGGYGY